MNTSNREHASKNIFDMLFKVIAAEGEHKASRALRQAAEVITDSPAALQVLYINQYI